MGRTRTGQDGRESVDLTRMARLEFRRVIVPTLDRLEFVRLVARAQVMRGIRDEGDIDIATLVSVPDVLEYHRAPAVPPGPCTLLPLPRARVGGGFLGGIN